MRIVKIILGGLSALIVLAIVGCSTVGLPRVSAAAPLPEIATPNLLAPYGGMQQVTTVENWQEERAPFWRNMLLSQVYGTIPAPVAPRIISDRIIARDILDGRASLREVQMQLTIGDHSFRQDVHFIIPNTPGPHPVILGAGSCPNAMILPFEGISEAPDVVFPDYCESGSEFMHSVATFIFGRYIEVPPLDQLIERGFAYGAYYPGMVVPDHSEAGLAALSTIREGEMEHGPYAAIGVWAWVAHRITDYIETNDELDDNRVVLFGHSRNGKSSLLAGALDQRIAGVIAHQSGTAGSSLQKNNVGETIAGITSSFPHWFTPSYGLYADRAQDLPFDQHALVALMAPRPLLLGNSARDQWSDPRGSFASARAAGDVYALMGSEPFTAENLWDFNAEAPLAYQFREGTHGITPEDWRPFLQWLTAQFG